MELAGYGLGIGCGILDFMDGYVWVLDFFLDDEGEGILILEDFGEVMDMDFEGLELSFLEEEGGFSKWEEGIGEECEEEGELRGLFNKVSDNAGSGEIWGYGGSLDKELAVWDTVIEMDVEELGGIGGGFEIGGRDGLELEAMGLVGELECKVLEWIIEIMEGLEVDFSIQGILVEEVIELEEERGMGEIGSFRVDELDIA